MDAIKKDAEFSVTFFADYTTIEERYRSFLRMLSLETAVSLKLMFKCTENTIPPPSTSSLSPQSGLDLSNPSLFTLKARFHQERLPIVNNNLAFFFIF